MRIPGIKTAKNFSRWMQARLRGGALILGYHRVANAIPDEYDVCVSQEHFSEHMDVVSKYAHPIPLSDLVRHLKENSVPPKSVAVTFDDGYADNLYHARPILEKYEVPATVFACTGYAGREFWWDELVRLVMSSQADLEVLHSRLGEIQFTWNQLGEHPDVNDRQVRRRFRHAVYLFLLSLDIEHQNQAMEIIRQWSGISTDAPQPARTMTQTELSQLAEGSLIEIGSHTRHQLMLPSLPLERQKEEITAGKKDLEKIMNKPVSSFSYPNGRATHDTKRAVREAGFGFACTSLHDVVRPGDDLFALTRFWQKNVSGDQFARGLKLWMTR